MVVERALHGLTVGIRVKRERVFDVDALDHEHAVFDLDLPGRLACEPTLPRCNVTRLQRAPEGAGQSTGGCSDDIVEGRRPLDVAST